MDDQDNIPAATLINREKMRIRRLKKRAYSADKRTMGARRLRDAIEALCGEIGQPLADMPESRRAIVRQAAAFIVQAEQTQAALAQGEAIDAEQLVRQANTLSRLLDDIGLSPAAQERRAAAEEQERLEAEARRLGVVTRQR